MTAEMLFSEGWLFAALLDMVEQHCGAGEGLLRSFGWKANARAMRLLAEASYIEILSEAGEEIEATVSPSGHDLLKRAFGQRS